MAEVAVTEGATGDYTPDMFSPLQFCEVVEDRQQTRHHIHQSSSERTLVNHTSHHQQSQQLITQTHQISHSPIEQSQSLLQVSQNTNSASHVTQTMSCSGQPTHLKSLPMSSPLLIVTNTSSQISTSQHSHLSECQPHITQCSQMPLTNNTHVINCHENQTDSKSKLIGSKDKSNSPDIHCIPDTLKDNKVLSKPHVNQNADKLVPMANLSAMSSIEYILAAPLSNVQLQSTNQSIVNLQQPFYQMQLARPSQEGHSLSFGALHVQGHAPTLALASQNGLSVPTVVGLQAVAADRFSMPASSQVPILNISPTTAAVATQTSQSDSIGLTTEDEPQIIYSTPIQKVPVAVTAASNTISVPEKKAVPIKKTWRRPWKKKKEREKKQAVKKSKKVKRKRIVMPKKNSIYIDPRHGPPLDTTKTVVQRIPEEHFIEPKQKRQRIKLNRNSGREYINRLGKVVCARKIGSPCNCPLKCWDRMGSKVLDIFNNFWDLCDFNIQNSYLFTCLKLCDVKRRYTKKTAEESRRQNTFEYFVRINGKHFRVCKKAFMSSHGLTSDKRLRTLFTQMKDGALVPEPDRRGKHFRPNKTASGLTVLSNNDISNTTIPTKSRSKKSKKKPTHARVEALKPAMYQPQHHSVGHIPHCAPAVTHSGTMQEPPHTYIPNGELYFPTHYLEPHQAMAPTHMNQIPQCQKMLDTPAYFMAGMKENTFHQ